MNRLLSQETEELLQEVLYELLLFLRSENEQRRREEFEYHLAETRAKRWGYPMPRKARRR